MRMGTLFICMALYEKKFSIVHNWNELYSYINRGLATRLDVEMLNPNLSSIALEISGRNNSICWDAARTNVNR